MTINQQGDYFDIENFHIGGQSHPYFGYLIVYNFTIRYYTGGFGDKIIRTINHEIVHFFLGQGHDGWVGSIMYPSNEQGGDKWTKDTYRRVMQNRDRMWFPRYTK